MSKFEEQIDKLRLAIQDIPTHPISTKNLALKLLDNLTQDPIRQDIIDKIKDEVQDDQ